MFLTCLFNYCACGYVWCACVYVCFHDMGPYGEDAVCKRVHRHVEARVEVRCFLHCSPSCMLKQGLTCGPRVSDVTVLVASLQQAPPSPLPECLDYRLSAMPTWHVFECWGSKLTSAFPTHPLDENWMFWIFQNGNSEIQFFSSPQGLLLLLILTIVVYLMTFANGFSNVDIICHLRPLMRLEVSHEPRPLPGHS